MAIIYKCTNNISGKVYIGQTIRSLGERKTEHLKELRSGRKGGVWQDDFNKYAENSFEFSTIEEELPIESLDDIERFYIDKLGSLEPNGYNKKLGHCSQISLEAKVAASNYSLDKLYDILHHLVKSGSVLKTSIVCKVPIDLVSDISSGKSYKWLELIYKEEYEVIRTKNILKIPITSITKLSNIVETMELLIEGKLSSIEISNKTLLSIDNVRDLKRGKSYKWLARLYPGRYEVMQGLVHKKICELNKSKTIVNILTGEEYTATSISNLAKLLPKLDARRISELISGKRTVLENIYVYKASA